MLPRILPFALFMVFIGLEELVRFFAARKLLAVAENFSHSLYPVKALAVAVVITFFWSRYQEIRLRDLARLRDTILSLLIGATVFFLCIRMDWTFGTFGAPSGFNPTVFTDPLTRTLFIGSRLAGAVIVVPIMEEIFWRSFLLRYLIDNDFGKIPIGTFTWGSFLISTVLFGLEHNFFIAGMMAGIAYNLLLYFTKSLSQCILAHAVTNLLLGIYVLQTGKWHFW